MTFRDILKRSFLDGFSTVEMTTGTIMAALLWTAVLGLYIFFCYRILTRRTFYSKNFNSSLVAMALLTAAIILTIQSSVVVSLGMVGALSIVRFRTAIKDPMDLVFLFWSISVGIICGAGLSEIALLASVVVTIVLFALDRIPVGRAPMILVINAMYSENAQAQISETLRAHCKDYKLKTTRIGNGQLDLVFELRIKEGQKLTDAIAKIQNVNSVSLLSHDGEVTF